jgi:hypothetical protein
MLRRRVQHFLRRAALTDAEESLCLAESYLILARGSVAAGNDEDKVTADLPFDGGRRS